MNPLVAVVVDALCCFRLTRLITEDGIFDKPRQKIVDRTDKFSELVECSWCVSIYFGVGIVIASRLAPKVFRPFAEAMALSAITGIVAERT